MNDKEYLEWIRDSIRWLEEQKKNHYLIPEETETLKELYEELEFLTRGK